MQITDQTIVLACAADENFAMPMAVTLHSALSHLPIGTDVHLFLLDGGMSVESKAKIDSVCRSASSNATINFITPDLNVLSELPLSQIANIGTYIRLCIPTTLPTHYDKIIYLDSDLVVRHNLNEVWQCDLNGSYAAGVRDYGNPYVSQGLSETFTDLNLSPETPYINAGFLVMNLHQWRKDCIAERVVDYTHTYWKHNRFADQDGINAVLGGNWQELDLKWNVQIDALRCIDIWPHSPFKQQMYKKKTQLWQNPAGVHFISARKPWNSGLFNPARHYFISALKASGWFHPSEYQKWHRVWLRNTIMTIIKDVQHGHVQKRFLRKIKAPLYEVSRATSI